MRKILLTIMIGIFLLSLISAQTITLNNQEYEVTSYSTDGIDWCLVLDNNYSVMPCSIYPYMSGEELIINETAIADLNRTVFLWYNDYDVESYINNSGSIIIADGYITNTPSNKQIKEVLLGFISAIDSSTPILDNETGKLNKDLLFDHEKTDKGSWLVDSLVFTNRIWLSILSYQLKEWKEDITNAFNSHNDRIIQLETENNAFKTCLQTSTTYLAYRQCVGSYLL